MIQVSECGDGFPYGDWTAPYRTAEGAEAVKAALGQEYHLLLERRRYDAWSEWWPKGPSIPIADAFNVATKFVVTHRRHSAVGAGGRLGPGSGGGGSPTQVAAGAGPGALVQFDTELTLLEHGLADEMLLIVYPALLA